jgi:hypothetical protein
MTTEAETKIDRLHEEPRRPRRRPSPKPEIGITGGVVPEPRPVEGDDTPLSAERVAAVFQELADMWLAVEAAEKVKGIEALTTPMALRLAREIGLPDGTFIQGRSMLPAWRDLAEATFMRVQHLAVMHDITPLGGLALLCSFYGPSIYTDRGDGKQTWHVWDSDSGPARAEPEGYDRAMKGIVEVLGIELEKRGLIPFARRQPFGG